MKRAGDYGYDAPYALVAFAAVGTISAIGAIVAAVSHRGPRAMLTFYGAFFLANALSFLYTTRRGKFLVWDDILVDLRLEGDERVLDMGCGRGAVSIAVAKRLGTGRVTGIDLWSTHDQSGNSPAAAIHNAELEGVEDRIGIASGDMRALPFPDASFRLVVSSLAIHNISSKADRERAVTEAWRVLEPGGRLVIADIRTTALYAGTLSRLGANGVTRRGLGWRFWYGNPIARTTLVTARKP
jgi:ubiquinone/menaquinone biosynthesis C-methylase UbiE